MKNAIEEEKVVMTADEAAFIDRFVAEHCRTHAVVMAERLRNFVAKRQMALFAVDDGPAFALAAGPATKVPSGVMFVFLCSFFLSFFSFFFSLTSYF